MSEYAAVEAFARSQEAFALIVGWLGGAEAAGLGHAGLEEGLEVRARELARLLMQDRLDLLAAAEQRRERVTGLDGVDRTRAEAGRTRPLSTVFGPVTVSRIALMTLCVTPARLASSTCDNPARLRADGSGQPI